MQMRVGVFRCLSVSLCLEAEIKEKWLNNLYSGWATTTLWPVEIT